MKQPAQDGVRRLRLRPPPRWQRNGGAPRTFEPAIFLSLDLRPGNLPHPCPIRTVGRETIATDGVPRFSLQASDRLVASPIVVKRSLS